MKLVMDACSIILLAKSSVLEVVSEKHQVYATKAVFSEVMKGKENMFPDSLLFERLASEKKVLSIDHNSEATKKMMKDFNMGAGEASTVAVALSNSEFIIVTDNLQGRKAATVNSLRLAGSVELIVSLFKRGYIGKEKAFSALNTLKKEGWFGQYLIDNAVEGIK